MDLKNLSANPEIILAMEPGEMKQLVADLAKDLQLIAQILTAVSQHFSGDAEIKPPQPQPVSAAGHYVPLKKILQRIKERGGDKKLTVDWLREWTLDSPLFSGPGQNRHLVMYRYAT